MGDSTVSQEKVREERRRIGKLLHDGICQQFTVATLLAYALEKKLAVRSLAEADDAAKLCEVVKKTGLEIRKLMKDLDRNP